jgi:cell division septum initiation protein DivIVA
VTKIVSIPIAFVTLILLSITASSVFSTAHAQTNATSANQTGKTSSSSTTAAQSEQASRSIKGAITSTGQFLNNATQKIVGSKSVQTIVNESSDLLGNATVATKKFFNPK